MIARLIVTYNSAEALAKFVSPLRAEAVETLVVDNASRDATRAVAAGLGYRVLTLGENHGFGTAIMRGLATLDADLVLVANPDITLDQTAVDTLVDAARRYPDADFFVPAIRKADGRAFFRYESQFEPRARHRLPPDGEACILAISGAVFLVRRAEFLEHGFDPEIFLYFEDDDLALSYAAAKRPMIYVPDAVAEHAANQSSVPTRATDRLKNLSFGWSWGYVMTKHGRGDAAASRRALLFRALRALLTLRFARARRHWEVSEGLARFLKGERAPYRPRQS